MFNTLPDKVVVEMKDEIAEFKTVVEDYSLPTPDISAAMSQIFEAMESPNYIEQDLMVDNCAIDMARGEGLYENARLTPYEEIKIREAVLKISKGIRNKLREINGKCDKYIYYCFERMLDEYTLVLKPMVNTEELF